MQVNESSNCRTGACLTRVVGGEHFILDTNYPGQQIAHKRCRKASGFAIGQKECTVALMESQRLRMECLLTDGEGVPGTVVEIARVKSAGMSGAKVGRKQEPCVPLLHRRYCVLFVFAHMCAGISVDGIHVSFLAHSIHLTAHSHVQAHRHKHTRAPFVCLPLFTT